MDYIDLFSCSKSALHSEIKPYFVLVYASFYILLDSTPNISLRFFISIFMNDIGV